MIDINTCSVPEFLEALQNNEIKIDLNGHFMNLKMDNSWKEKSLLTQLKDFLEREIEREHSLPDIGIKWHLSIINGSCNCGERLYPEILDPTTIGFESECPYKDGLPLQTVRIEVPTGKMIFCNFFRCDGLFDPEDQYSDKFSINQIQGRINYAKHYAEKHNIGYAQMGNMSGDVYVNPGKDKVIIGSDNDYQKDYEAYGYTKPNPEWVQAVEDGFVSKGTIDMSMWRWMCIDESLLPEGIEVVERVDVDLVPGKYEIIHYYDTTPDSKEFSRFKYSTIERIQN